MVKIHWSAYIIISVLVLLASYRIDPQKFKLFIWIGYLFLIIGVAKLGIWFVNRGKERPFERREIRREIYSKMPRQQRMMRYCPRCGNVLQGYENFCAMCGQRVR